MNTKLVAATSAAAFLGVLGGYLMGHRETDRLRLGFEAEAQILERAASASALETQKAESDARQLAEKLAGLEKSRAQLLELSNSQQKEIRDLTVKLHVFELVRAEHEKAAQLEAVRMKQAFARIDDRTPLSVDQVVSIAQAFHEIEHHVAAGEFPGLALGNAYQRLKALLDNTEIERLIADYDTAVRRCP